MRRIKKYTPMCFVLLRRKYLAYKQVSRMRKLNICVVKYLESSEILSKEQENILNYLRHNLNSNSPFPYAFPLKYNPNNIIVYRDKNLNMRYVIHENKRLYFKKSWDKYLIQAYYNSLMIEQDVESPHRYETDGFQVGEGDVVVDVGGAEGNFALSIVEKASKVYIFESDQTWIEVLKATFAPWKEKVIISSRYVSNNDFSDNITLDNFFRNREKIDFIKADIEGAEIKLLEGCQEKLLTHVPLKIVLCTYHRQDDAIELNQVLVKNGFRTEFSKGYMIFPADPNIAPPFIRRGLIRGIK
jgi:hypothetical protein